MPCWGGHAVAQSSAYHSELECTVKCDQYVLEMFFEQATDRIVELKKYHVPKDLNPAPKTPANVITVLRKGSNKRTSYHCRDCNRDFTEEKALHQHLATERQHQEWYCCPCDQFFPTAESYDIHMTKSPAHFLPLPLPVTPSQHTSSKPWTRSQTPTQPRKSLDFWFARERSHNQSSGSWAAMHAWGRPEPPPHQSPPTPEPPETASWQKWLPRDTTPDKSTRRTSLAVERGPGVAVVDDSAAEEWEDWGCKKSAGASWLPWGGGSKAIGRSKWEGGYEQMVQPRV